MREVSSPPSESDSEPDSEAISRRRKREGYPFPEAVALLEKFMEESEEKIEETHQLYSIPGNVLTMEEISALDRKVLGIAAIRRRIGEKMKKLEEDCWKEMEEVLGGRGTENDRNEEKLSFLLAIIKPSCDVSALSDFLKINDFPFKMDSTFENLASFAKIYAVKQEKAAEIEEEETNRQVAKNTVQVSSGGPQANNLPGLLQQKKMSVGHTVSAHLMVLTGKVEKKRLGRRQTKDNGESEVKKEVKEEKDEEMAEGGGNTATDQPARVEKELSKRTERKKTGQERISGDRVKGKTNGKPAEAVVKEEEVDGGYEEGAVPTQEPAELDTEPSQEPRRNDDGGAFWKSGVNFHIYPANIDSLYDHDHVNDGLDHKDPLFGGFERNDQRQEENQSEARDDPIEGGVEHGSHQRTGRESANRKSDRIVGKEQADLDFHNNYDEMDDDLEDRASPLEDMDSDDKPARRRRSRLAASVKYTMDKDSDDETSDEDGEESSESYEEEERVKRLRRSRQRTVGDGVVEGDEEEKKKKKEGEGEMEQEEEAQDDSVDDGNEERKCPVDGCSEKFTSSEDMKKHVKKHPAPWICGVCQRQWSSRVDLRRHFRRHTGERPFQCQTCKKSFTVRSHLCQHQRIHTGEKPYKCATCQKTFTQSNTLKRGFDIDFQVKSTFEGLAPFAESYASGQDLNAEEEAGSSPFVATGHAVPSEGYQINGGDALVLRLSRLPEQPTVAKEEVEEVRSVDGNVDEEEDVLPVKMEVKEEEEQNRSRRRAAPFPAWTVPKVEEPWSPQENDDEATEALSVKSEVREEEEQNEVIGGDGNEENPPPLMTDFPGIADVGDDFAFHRNESPLPTRNPAKKRKIMETEEEEGTSEGEDDGRQRRERESANRKSNRVVGKEQANIDFDNNYEEKDDVLEDRGSPLGDMEPNDRLRSIRRRVLRDELGENDQEEEKKMKEKEDEEEQAQNDSMDDGNEERKCPVDGCSEKFTSFEGVMKHMKKHPAPWICGVCKRQWPRRTHLRQHYRIHCGEKPFKCATCQKTFSQSNNLKTHQRIHTGERSYECYVCDYKTSEPSNLKRHQRMHTGERPYPCTVCKKSFTQSFDLTRHMRIHTGERPYECDKCDYRATRLRNLQSHKRTHSH